MTPGGMENSEEIVPFGRRSSPRAADLDRALLRFLAGDDSALEDWLRDGPIR